MFKRKLLKRALPIILSVAMVFETMPATALAAEYDEVEITEEADLEETVADDEDAEASDAETKEVDVQEGSSTPQETETTGTDTDNNKTETEIATETEDVTEVPEAENATEVVEANADIDVQAAALDTKITIKESWLIDYMDYYDEYGYLKYDADKKAIIAKYDDAESNVFGTLKSRIQEDFGESFQVKVDGSTVDYEQRQQVIDNLSFEWQKKTGEEYAGMSGAVPTEPGEYRLQISLAAIDGVCQAATASQDFIITKRQLSVGVVDGEIDLDLLSVTPGTTVGAFVDNLKGNYILKKEDRTWDSDLEILPEAARDIYLKTFSPVVYEINGTEKTALSNDAILKENCDYVLEITVELNDAVSYELADMSAMNIKVEDLVETKVKVELKDFAAEISKVYSKDSKISYDADIKDKVTVSIVVPGEEDEEDTPINGAVPTLVWCDADKQELGADPDAAPSEAGTYYLDFQYIPSEDNANVYKESKENYVKVVIEPATLTLKPLELTGTYYTGMSEDDVLKDADYKLVDAAGADFSFEKSTFWGVSYDKPGTATQSYEPIFKLVRAEKDENGSAKKDKDGNEIWSDNSGNLNASRYLYRLVFTGKKAVYKADGTENDVRDVNGGDVNTADKNHNIDTTAKALSDNYVNVNVTDATSTKIDVSAILAAGVPATETLYDLYKPNHFLSKVYDGSMLYDGREAYKLAKVTTADGTAIAENYADTLTYTWYELGKPVADIDETGKQVGWKEGDSYKVSGNSIPRRAGDYKLVISFSDVKGGYAPSSKTLYYKIDKQMVVVSPTSIPTAYKDTSVSSYINRMELEGTYNIYQVPNNDFSAEYKTEANLITTWMEYEDYDLNWYVERLERNDDKTPKKDENGNDIYKRLERKDSFKVLDENYYRLGVELSYYGSNYTNYEVVYYADVEKKNFDIDNKYYNDYANITVKEMGDIEIEIEVDESKLTTTKTYDGNPFYNMTLEEARAEIMKAVTITKVATGEPLSANDPVPALDMYFVDDYEGAEDYASEYPVNQIVNAGPYHLVIEFAGDETYKASYCGINPKYNIIPLDLKVTPYMVEGITAGDKIVYPATGNDGSYATSEREGDILYYSSMTVFDCEGMPEQDKPAFVYGELYRDEEEIIYGFPAYAQGEEDGIPSYEFDGTITKLGNTQAYAGYVKYGTDYALQLYGSLAYPYSRNYAVEYVRYPFKAAFRGSSTPKVIDRDKDEIASTIDGTSIISRYNAQDSTMTVTPMGGIPYVSSFGTKKEITDIDGDKITLEGNYFVFKIIAPSEFKEDQYDYEAYFGKFVYKNSIEKNAKGYVVSTDSSNGEITIVIPVTKDDETKEFDIVWESGYTEKYIIDLTNAVLLDDLTKAVAPKSLTFNGVNTKMVVGEEQQLDVKIKKAQINDIIYLDYRIKEGERTDVLSITNDDEKKTAGYVTALSVGTTTVEVMPVRMENGVKTDIPNAKPASVKITVSDVTAPAIKKVTAIDTKVEIDYTKPSNGYRREVYIVEGSSKLKEDEIKQRIDSMKNEQWNGIFAVAPKYYTNESANAKTKLTNIVISGLKPDTEYTVYVRNVSGVRTLHDGTQVVASAKGTVKGFKTTKAQIKALDVFFKEVKDAEVEGSEPVEKKVYTKKVLLSQKTEQLYTLGRFYQKPEYAAADDTDMAWLEMPLDTKTYKEYVAPKLTYFLSAEPVDIEVEDIRDFRNYIYVAGKYYKKTAIATIDKNGKIALKGVGTVYVWAYDPATKLYSNDAVLDILALPTSVTGKGGKLAVGKGIYLSSLLTYSEEKTKLTGYETPYLSITDEALKALNDGNFSVIPTGDGDYYITALKPNATCNITVTDRLVALAGGNASATLTIQSSAIEAVKNMKITDIVDDGFVLNFAYPVEADNETYYTNLCMWFRVDVTDARGSIVDSFIVSHDNFIEGYYADINDFNADIWNYASNYDGKKKLFSYRLPINSDKIVRLSSYKVSVTPVYGEETSPKPTVKPVKTTNFPASYESVPKGYYGGVGIDVVGIAGDAMRTEWADLYNRPYLTSGNAYTLRISDNYDIAKDRATDSLTWKSSNTKVATVKANAGTYTASLNAVKEGVTVLEVTSKVTKKVIARFPIFVKAAGNAKDNYYGDYEYIGEYTYEFDPFYNSNVEVLTEANPVHVTAAELAVDNWLADGNYKWVKFTAPAFGNYTFNVKNGSIDTVITPSSDKPLGTTGRYTMFAGQTYYFKVNLDQVTSRNDFEMTVSATKVGSNLTVESGSIVIDSESSQYIEFRATEDNYYTFYTEDGNTNGINGIYKLNDAQKLIGATYDSSQGKYSISLKTGDVIYLSVNGGKYSLYATKRNAIALSTGKAENLSVTGKDAQWYVFTAPVAGTYTFKSANATEMIYADYYSSIEKRDADKPRVNTPYDTDVKDFTYDVALDAEQKVAFKVYPANATGSTAVTATISVTAEAADTIAVDGEKTLSIPEGGVKWLSAKLDAAGRYTFNFAATEENESYGINTRYYINEINPSKGKSANVTKEFVVSSDKAANDADAEIGDTIYVQVSTTKKSGSTGTEGEPAAPAVASVKATLKKAVLTTLTAGTASDLTVENGGEYWYTFTALSTGKYVFRSVVTTNETGGTHSLTAAKYDSIETKHTYEDLVFERNYNLEAGETVVFKASPTYDRFTADGNPATTKAQIRVDKLEAKSFTTAAPEVISLAKGDVKWYSFTATEDNKYTFTKDVTAGDATVQMYSGLGGTGYIGVVANVKPCDMKQGDIVYFKVAQQGEEAAALTLKAEVPAIETMATETVTPSVTNAAMKNYVYTVATKGRYEISYTTPENTKATVTYGLRSFDNITNKTVSNGYAELDSVAAGTKIYIQVSTASEAAVNVNLTVKPVTPTPINAATNNATATPNKYTWYSFTATEAGRYVFSKKDAESNSTTVRYYEELTDSSSLSYSTLTRYLKVGESVYIRVEANASEQQTTSLTVEKIVPTPITAESTSITLKPGETKYYIFTAEVGADYAFNVSKTVTPETGDPYTVMPDISKSVYKNIENSAKTYNWGNSITLNKTENLTFALTSKASEDETFNLTYENIDSKVIWIEKLDTPTPITVKKGETQWIGFEAPEDGFFAINTDGVNSRAEVSLHYKTESLDAAEKRKYPISYYYDTTPGEDGAEVTEPASISFNVKVSRVTLEELTLEKPVNATVAKYEQKWVKFTAPEDGRYSFNSGDGNLELSYKLYDCEDGEVGDPYDSGTMPYKNVALSKGQEIALAVYYDTGKNASESFNISVTKATVNPTSGTINETFKEGENKWYEYTAPQTGTYEFAVKAADGVYVNITACRMITSGGSDWLSSGDKVSLTMGDKLYLGIEIYNYTEEEAQSVEISIQYVERALETISLNTNAPVVFDDNLEGKWFAFTPDEDGFYNFEITSSGKYLYNTCYTTRISMIDKSNDSSVSETKKNGSRNILFNNKLVAQGDTVYVYIEKPDSYSATDKITINVTKNDNQIVKIKKLDTIGVSRHSIDQGANNGVYYAFYAPTKGDYEIRFTADENDEDEMAEEYYIRHYESTVNTSYYTSDYFYKDGDSKFVSASYDNQLASFFYIRKDNGEPGKEFSISVRLAE